jgi:ABC-type multidrug transport system ATPase subunit
MGKLDSSWVTSGSLLVNNCPSLGLSSFQSILGYVPQDDIMHRTLSVAQNITYSAEIRLPRCWSAQQRQFHAESVMNCLNLGEVREVRVGDETDRGISGGQRKRLSVAIELAAAPSALFLDGKPSIISADSLLVQLPLSCC